MASSFICYALRDKSVIFLNYKNLGMIFGM